MKSCPVCKARCFDDMEICYGCMHRFEQEEGNGDAPIGKEAAPAGQVVEQVATEQASADAAAMSPGTVAASAGMVDAQMDATSAPAGVKANVATPPNGSAPNDGMPPNDDASKENAMPNDDASNNDAPANGEFIKAGFAPLCFEPAIGVLATASLGNGYRLVLSIDKE